MLCAAWVVFILARGGTAVFWKSFSGAGKSRTDVTDAAGDSSIGGMFRFTGTERLY